MPSSRRQVVELRLPLLYTHTPVVMSAEVIRGRRAGPSLFVSAAVHGDEINGVEIIRRLARSTALKHLRGTLILVPVVNVYGFVRQSGGAIRLESPDDGGLRVCFCLPSQTECS